MGYYLLEIEEQQARIKKMEDDLKAIAKVLKCGIFEVTDRVGKFLARMELLQREVDELKIKLNGRA
jgi:hypothetical protein